MAFWSVPAIVVLAAAMLNEGAEPRSVLFVIVPSIRLGLVLIVIVALAPGAMLPSAHVTVPAEKPHVPAVEVALTKVTFAGSVSVTTAEVAVACPMFETASV